MPLGLAAVFVPKASDVLAEKLRELILSRALAEGTPLPTERELVAQSGLSRTSVREALRVLETEGVNTVVYVGDTFEESNRRARNGKAARAWAFHCR